MSPRPRQASDDQIFQAAFRAVSRVGPVRLTLADVAGEAGLSAAALVQRFGSKRGLLLAAVSSGSGGNDVWLADLRARHRSPFAALLALADCMVMMGSTPEAIANTLAFLQIDLTDPDFHRHAVSASQSTRDGIRALVKDAIATGELRRTEAGRLASAIHATLNGSLLNWAVHREHTLVEWIRRDLKTLLEPYRTRRRRRRPPARRLSP